MKTILSTFILSAFFLFGNMQQSYAQQNETQNYVVLTKKVAQLKPILLAAKALAEEDGENFGNFEIIVCGQGVSDLSDVEKLQPHLAEIQKIGATLVACGFSLKKFNVDRYKLPKEIKIEDNGILYDFRLQKKGYKSLSL